MKSVIKKKRSDHTSYRTKTRYSPNTKTYLRFRFYHHHHHHHHHHQQQQLLQFFRPRLDWRLSLGTKRQHSLKSDHLNQNKLPLAPWVLETSVKKQFRNNAKKLLIITTILTINCIRLGSNLDLAYVKLSSTIIKVPDKLEL